MEKRWGEGGTSGTPLVAELSRISTLVERSKWSKVNWEVEREIISSSFV